MFHLISCSTSSINYQVEENNQKTIKSKVPTNTKNLTLVDHGYFKIFYDKDLRLARYVSYELTRERLLEPKAKRKNLFREDPLLIKFNLPRVKPSEYRKSGYDRGHLAPSADFLWDQKANDLTFVMSNMAPQKPSLNRIAWKQLEAKIRGWACGEEKLIIVSGPIVRRSSKSLASGLTIPDAFFKIIIDETPPKKLISFIYYQDDSKNLINERIVTLPQLEVAVNLKFDDFFKDIPANQRHHQPLISEWKTDKCN